MRKWFLIFLCLFFLGSGLIALGQNNPCTPTSNDPTRVACDIWTNCAWVCSVQGSTTHVCCVTYDANGTTAERAFDPLMRLTNLVNRADAGILSSFAITLDDADQRTQVLRENGKTYAYAYDPIGNRQHAILNNSTNTYNANELNQYTSVESVTSVVAPVFDDGGNMAEYGE